MCRGQDIILVPQNQAWANLIEATYKEKAHAFTRYATKKNTDFDDKMLKDIVWGLPKELELRCIDQQIYDACLEETWSQDLVANYDHFLHYQQFGVGVVILHKGQMVAGASSYSTYQDGIEIEIDTHPDYRRKGLAKIAGTKLILECLARGLYSSWDAHTKVSLHLALQLGYEFSHEYRAYEIDWKKEKK
ncbi:GNAT acetyltransferase [Chlamydia trachomatis]|nr:GNAT acetyltransferase [Chlamydia trachomatis]